MALQLLQRKQRVEAALGNASVSFEDNLVEIEGAFVLIDDEGNELGEVNLPEVERQMLEVLRTKNGVDLTVGDVLCVIPDPATVADRAAFAAQPYAVLLVEELLVNNAAAIRFVGATSNDGDANAIAATTAVATAAFGARGTRFNISRDTFENFVTLRESLHSLVDDLSRELGLLPGGPVAQVVQAPAAPQPGNNDAVNVIRRTTYTKKMTARTLQLLIVADDKPKVKTLLYPRSHPGLITDDIAGNFEVDQLLVLLTNARQIASDNDARAFVKISQENDEKLMFMMDDVPIHLCNMPHLVSISIDP